MTIDFGNAKIGKVTMSNIDQGIEIKTKNADIGSMEVDYGWEDVEPFEYYDHTIIRRKLVYGKDGYLFDIVYQAEGCVKEIKIEGIQ